MEGLWNYTVRALCCCLVTKSCLTLWRPHGLYVDLPGSSVQKISQARILEWAAISRGSSQPRDQTCVPCIGRWILYHGATKEANGALEKKQIRKKVFTSRNYLEKISCFKPTQTFTSRKIRSNFPALSLPRPLHRENIWSNFPALSLPRPFSPRGEVEKRQERSTHRKMLCIC